MRMRIRRNMMLQIPFDSFVPRITEQNDNVERNVPCFVRDPAT